MGWDASVAIRNMMGLRLELQIPSSEEFGRGIVQAFWTGI